MPTHQRAVAKHPLSSMRVMKITPAYESLGLWLQREGTERPGAYDYRHVDRLISRRHEQCHPRQLCIVVDIVKWYNLCVFDIIDDLAFGESFECLERRDYHSGVATVIHHFKAAVVMGACQYRPLILSFTCVVSHQKFDTEATATFLHGQREGA